MAEITRKELILALICAGERPRLMGLDLSGADLSALDLRGANLSGADLSNAILFGANMSRTALRGANLSYALMDSGTSLIEADLTGAILTGATMGDVQLSNTKVTEDELANSPRELGQILLRAARKAAQSD